MSARNSRKEDLRNPAQAGATDVVFVSHRRMLRRETQNRLELVMVDFESLPQASRSLILTKLALEIVSADCRNILELARKRNRTIQEVWHDLCRKAALPPCEMPPEVIAPHMRSLEAAPLPSTIAVSEATQVANTVAAPPIANGASSSPASRDLRAQHWPVILAVGGGVIVAGVALFTLVSAMSPSQVVTARPAEVIRTDADKPGKSNRESVYAPPPKGTVNRMDAISKSFSKK